jgi:hypothetical protein
MDHGTGLPTRGKLAIREEAKVRKKQAHHAATTVLDRTLQRTAGENQKGKRRIKRHGC